MAVAAGQDAEHLVALPREGELLTMDREAEPRNVELDLLDETAVRHREVAFGRIGNRHGRPGPPWWPPSRRGGRMSLLDMASSFQGVLAAVARADETNLRSAKMT